MLHIQLNMQHIQLNMHIHPLQRLYRLYPLPLLSPMSAIGISHFLYTYIQLNIQLNNMLNVQLNNMLNIKLNIQLNIQLNNMLNIELNNIQHIIQLNI